MNHMKTDVAIVGAGPAGLFMAYEAGFVGYKSVLIDAQPDVGGQLSALYPEKPIYDVPGCWGILAGELVTRLKTQADSYAPEYLLNQHAHTLEGEVGGFVITTSGGTTLACKAVVVAGGGGMFAPRKPMGLENLEAYETTGSVRYAIKNIEEFRDKRVVLAGGGDSAVDWALALAKVAQHIDIVHRRAEFRAAEASVNAMQELEKTGKITIYTPCEVVRLCGASGVLSGVSVRQSTTETETTLAATHLVCCFGLLPTAGPVATWGLGLAKGVIPVNPITLETCRPGVLCVGDMATYEEKISLIITGFAEAPRAAKTLQRLINPEKKWRVQYSTSKGAI